MLPDIQMRRDEFVRIMEQFASDDSHGYSQKPPSGRWGPDYDCSSLIYEAASLAGYPVGRSNDGGKVRFTGTMLEDFKKAGFQILPFANVGLGELEVGDILLNLALHAEVYVGEEQVVGAESSEDGGYSGEAGDQTGQEIVKQPVYVHDRGWDYVLRPPAEDGDDEEDEPADEDQGGQEMPYYPNYGPNSNTVGNMGGNMPWPGATQNANRNVGWPQGGYGNYTGNYGNTQQSNYPNQAGYPQGNLGQMNGYSQATGKQLTWVNGMEGARDHHLAPNSCEAMFDQQDPSIMYVKSTDQQGFPNIRVFKTTEISEDIPQHHMPGEGYSQEMGGMHQGQFVSRQEFEELKEMISNVQSAVSGTMEPGHQQGNAGQSKSGGTRGGNSRNS